MLFTLIILFVYLGSRIFGDNTFMDEAQTLLLVIIALEMGILNNKVRILNNGE